MISKLEQLLEVAKAKPRTVSVALAQDEVVLAAAKEAVQEKLATFRFYGEAKEIEAILDSMDFREGFTTVDCRTKNDAIVQAVRSVSTGEADILMKGNVKTGELLGVFLKDEYGLKSGRTMNLVTLFQLERYPKLLTVTDAGMVIAPDLKQKADSIINASLVAKALGIERPKVAILAAIETVNEKMPATLEAAVLSQMARRKQLGNVEVDGPFALDNAISPEAASHKGVTGPVAGQADILLMPDIEAGNIFYKAMAFLAGAELASTIVGGRVPIILTSRADSAKAKLYSIALNVILAGVV